MSNPMLLNNVTHKDLKITTERGALYGDNIRIANIVPNEFAHVIAEYPIFLSKDSETGKFLFVVLLGFEKDENLFLDGNNWTSTYIPLDILRQPFLIGHQKPHSSSESQEVIFIDMNHPRATVTTGEPIFLELGGSSAFLEKISSILAELKDGTKQTEFVVTQLSAENLIEPLKLDITLENQSTITVHGLYTINHEKLRALPVDVAGNFNAKGILELAYLLIASIPRINTLIDKKNKKLKAASKQ
jgi:hypothetical protein